jgi:hypothetical protein
MDALIEALVDVLDMATTIKEDSENTRGIIDTICREDKPEVVARLLYLTDLKYAEALYNELEYWIKHEPQDKSKESSL